MSRTRMSFLGFFSRIFLPSSSLRSKMAKSHSTLDSEETLAINPETLSDTETLTEYKASPGRDFIASDNGTSPAMLNTNTKTATVTTEYCLINTSKEAVRKDLEPGRSLA